MDSASSAPASDRAESRRLRGVLAAAALAMFCVQLDFFALTLALPRMASDLRVSTTDLQWALSGYMLALGAFLVLGGRLGDIFGRRLVLVSGLGIFGAAAPP
jgi:MFS family permease